MQRKTLTTLNQLRIGDSFVFLKKDEAWRVTAREDKSGKVAFNKFLEDGRQVLQYDELRKGKTPVVFLRHTIPLPGEECFILDLVPGDVFHKTDDVVHEYVVVESGHHFWKVRRLDMAATEFAGKIATVVFVRHKEVIHTTLN